MFADLVVANGRVLTLNSVTPTAEAVAIRSGRILAVGSNQDIRHLASASTRRIDAEGCLVVPAFHDAHLHLLSFARTLTSVDLRRAASVGEVQALLRNGASSEPGGWVRAWGFDEAALAERRFLDRFDLDAAIPDRPVRVQHRTLHLDVLNTRALRVTGLMDLHRVEVERDPATNEASGRLFNAAELLRGRTEDPLFDRSSAVRRASECLLAWGITSIQDATATNGPDEWALLHVLAESGALRVRTWMMPGARDWQELSRCRPSTSDLRLGPVKLMLDERDLEVDDLRNSVRKAHAAGHAVAVHAVSEAEVAVALDLLGSPRPATTRAPDRIEHGAVIPDDSIPDLARHRIAVVGQPALVWERGSHYLREYPPELHPWLYRAASLVHADVLYAASSDAPVTRPNPLASLYTLMSRTTREGSTLGAGEALPFLQALRAHTLEPARAVGAEGELGRLSPGARADLVVLATAEPTDLARLSSGEPAPALASVRCTIRDGQVVWEN